MRYAPALRRLNRPLRAACAAALLFISPLCPAAAAPAQADAAAAAAAAAEIDRVLAKKESKWQCAPLAKTGAATAQRAPRGAYYQLRCRRRELIVVGLVFFAETEQDAARRLERSLADPQLFQGAPAPLAGLGEQAYQQRRPGAASIAFRRGQVFAQVSAGMAPAEGSSPQAKLEKATAEAAKTARRFAGHLAGEKETK
jgi:hypothetical protein